MPESMRPAISRRSDAHLRGGGVEMAAHREHPRDAALVKPGSAEMMPRTRIRNSVVALPIIRRLHG
jgi:hypothetical protein